MTEPTDQMIDDAIAIIKKHGVNPEAVQALVYVLYALGLGEDASSVALLRCIAEGWEYAHKAYASMGADVPFISPGNGTLQ